VINSISNNKKKERWSLIGTPPMQEPRLIEVGKLRLGAAGVASSSIIAAMIIIMMSLVIQGRFIRSEKRAAAA